MKNILEKSIVQQLTDVKGNVIYFPDSVRKTEYFTICSAQDEGSRFLLLATTIRNAAFDAFEGETTGDGEIIVKKAPLSAKNAAQLRKTFPWTAPVPVLRERCSFGCGDRLGCATSAHAELFKIYDAKPIFAQQSVRELTLTNRTFQSVVDDATFQVFQAGYEGGFGADGDHLKSFEHIKQALDAGVTMLTLDLSEQLKPEFASADEATVKAAYDALDDSLKARMEQSYTEVPELGLKFTDLERMRCALIYTQAMDFSAQVRTFLNENGGAETDLEISIDETTAPTVPEHHFFVASELKYRGVNFVSLAPRFIGEFQKGIDYIGDLAEFERQFAVHAKIAAWFKSYKLSIHSGSDKFSVFPIIGRLTEGRVHVKTAGTSWLEAANMIAQEEPALFRDMVKCAFESLADARKLYHVTADFDSIPAVDTIADADLVKLLDADNIPGRQLIHITYGAMLGGKYPELTARIRKALLKNHAAYAACINRHFTNHLEKLLIGKK